MLLMSQNARSYPQLTKLQVDYWELVKKYLGRCATELTVLSGQVTLR